MKPCPFCGASAEVLRHNLVICSNVKCPVSNCIPFTKEEWNTRHDQSVTQNAGKKWTAEELVNLWDDRVNNADIGADPWEIFANAINKGNETRDDNNR